MLDTKNIFIVQLDDYGFRYSCCLTLCIHSIMKIPFHWDDCIFILSFFFSLTCLSFQLFDFTCTIPDYGIWFPYICSTSKWMSLCQRMVSSFSYKVSIFIRLQDAALYISANLLTNLLKYYFLFYAGQCSAYHALAKQE